MTTGGRRVTVQANVCFVFSHLYIFSHPHQEEGVMFAALYWEEPDTSGHRFGPDNTTAMSKTLKEVRELFQEGVYLLCICPFPFIFLLSVSVRRQSLLL